MLTVSSLSQIIITVIEARGIKAADMGGTSDPYVELRLTNDTQHHNTKPIKKTLNPFWDEQFTMYPKDPEKGSLLIKLYDYNPVKANKLLGECTLVFFFLCSCRVLLVATRQVGHALTRLFSKSR
jgi:Ca2+-dependent lipid-binding protein